MELSPDLKKAFDTQIAKEFESSMVYRQLAIEADTKDLPGVSLWLRNQADEEVAHANKFIDHVVDRGNRVTLGALAAPRVDEGISVLKIFEIALANEEGVSEAIRELVRTAEAAGDLDSRPLLNWFLNEQIEEEATVSEICGRIRLIGEDGPGLLRLDTELSNRPPATTAPTAG